MKKAVEDWIQSPKVNQIINSFNTPKTPRQVEKELGITKLKMKPYLEGRLIKCLNPDAKKDRLHTLTNKTIRLLQISPMHQYTKKDWDLIGWITASPKQRLVVLKVLDSVKRTSENIRQRASSLNPCLSRISTKWILSELASKYLVETELISRKRYYWVSNNGRKILSEWNRLIIA